MTTRLSCSIVKGTLTDSSEPPRESSVGSLESSLSSRDAGLANNGSSVLVDSLDLRELLENATKEADEEDSCRRSIISRIFRRDHRSSSACANGVLHESTRVVSPSQRKTSPLRSMFGREDRAQIERLMQEIDLSESEKTDGSCQSDEKLSDDQAKPVSFRAFLVAVFVAATSPLNIMWMIVYCALLARQWWFMKLWFCGTVLWTASAVFGKWAHFLLKDLIPLQKALLRWQASIAEEARRSAHDSTNSRRRQEAISLVWAYIRFVQWQSLAESASDNAYRSVKDWQAQLVESYGSYAEPVVQEVVKAPIRKVGGRIRRQ